MSFSSAREKALRHDSMLLTYKPHVMAFTANRNNTAIVFLITNVKQFVEAKAVFATQSYIWLHVIKLTKQARESDMALVIEACLAKDKHTIL